MNVPPTNSLSQSSTNTVTVSTGNSIPAESSFWSCIPKSEPFNFALQNSLEPILSNIPSASITLPKLRPRREDAPLKSPQEPVTCVKMPDARKLNKASKDKIYKCEKCDYSSRFQNGLDYHMRKQHGKGEQFACSDCGYICFLKQNLHQHMRQHTGEKPFACASCEYASASKSGLRYHVRTKHDKTNLISCTICNYRAYNTHILTQHLRKHSGLRPFTCVLCDATFTVKPSWKYHMKAKHNITNLASSRGQDQANPASNEVLPSTSKDFQESTIFRADGFSPS